MPFVGIGVSIEEKRKTIDLWCSPGSDIESQDLFNNA